ncbi:Hypothetical predicted protein, partial [Podarcis lilfordi]
SCPHQMTPLPRRIWPRVIWRLQKLRKCLEQQPRRSQDLWGRVEEIPPCRKEAYPLKKRQNNPWNGWLLNGQTNTLTVWSAAWWQ